ncbi:hypothetical protein ON010_g15855 [Phytophthora cinnamomi]|nr:hypothetical protein ON010_g15855 [Phytophthora cinnamomi]
MGLVVLSTIDPTGIAYMASQFVQPICGPTAYLAFIGSYGTWTKKGDGVVHLNFESVDDEDVTVVIHSGGDKYAEVDVAAGAAVTWEATIPELQDKTLYLDRWRPGIMGIPGSGGGFVLQSKKVEIKDHRAVDRADVFIGDSTSRWRLEYMICGTGHSGNDPPTDCETLHMQCGDISSQHPTAYEFVATSTASMNCTGTLLCLSLKYSSPFDITHSFFANMTPTAPVSATLNVHYRSTILPLIPGKIESTGLFQSRSQCALGSFPNTVGEDIPTILRLTNGTQTFAVTPADRGTDIVELTTNKQDIRSSVIDQQSYSYSASASNLGMFRRSLVLQQEQKFHLPWDPMLWTRVYCN